MKKTVFLLCIMWLNSAYATDLSLYEHPMMLAVPELEMVDNHGNSHSLKDHKGKVILLNFWATWCKPCIEEMPSLERLHAKLDPKKVVVLPVSIERSSIKKIDAFYKKLRLTSLPILKDKDHKSYSLFTVKSLPQTLVINPSGREVSRIPEPLKWDDDMVVEYLHALWESHFSNAS